MPAFHLTANVFHSYLKITQNPSCTINVVTKGMLSHFVSGLEITNLIFPHGRKSKWWTKEKWKSEQETQVPLWSLHYTEFPLRVTLKWPFFSCLSSQNICKGLITVQVGVHLVICWAYAIRYQRAADPEWCTCSMPVCQCISQQRKQKY